MKNALYLGVAALALAWLTAPAPLSAQSIDNDDIGGVVTGPNGPEAGVWVIAETTDLPTRYTKSVVTDDQGRYVIPDLPTANYQVWVRGYGLVEFAEDARQARPDAQSHRGAGADDGRGGALLSGDLLVHDDEDSAGEGFRRLDRHPEEHHAGHLAQRMNNVDCVGCHQLGQESTRTIPAQFGKFNSGADAWIRRIAVRPVRRDDDQPDRRPARRRALQVFRRLDRPRRQGRAAEEQAAAARRASSAISWSPPGTGRRPDKYLHDLISSDRRKPTVNADGPLYGAPEYSTDNMPILDPKTHKVSFFKMPVADPNMPLSLGPGHAGAIKPTPPSAYWGDEVLWDTKANQHNAMFDDKGRVWLAATVRGMDNPACCKKGSDHPSAKVFPIDRSPRQVAVLDPKTHEILVHRHLLRHPSSAVRL